MAQGRKYAALPDLDSAPDIYETQDAAEDARSAASGRSSSAASSYVDPDEAPGADDPAASGVDRAQLQPGSARTHFRPARVDARNVDFSDRVGGARSSYRVGSRRRQTEFETTATGDEDDETFQEKLARLKREVEEIQSLSESTDAKATADDKDVVASLSQVLEGLQSNQAQARSTTHDAAPNHAQDSTTTGPSADELAKLPIPDMASTERALSLAATLESRLSALEHALGLPALSLPAPTAADASSPAHDRPIFATLANLDRQLQTLTSASAPSLSALASQIQSLTASAESLAAARKAAAAARKDLRATQPTAGGVGSSRPVSSHSFSTSRPASYTPSSAADAGGAGLSDVAAALLAGEESEQAARLARLSAALPTVEALAPLVPGMLDRLASLRVLHEHAGVAAEGLDAVEAGQARLAADLREWRAALDALDAREAEGKEGERRNREVVEGWVRELERRVGKMRAEA